MTDNAFNALLPSERRFLLALLFNNGISKAAALLPGRSLFDLQERQYIGTGPNGYWLRAKGRAVAAEMAEAQAVTVELRAV